MSKHKSACTSGPCDPTHLCLHHFSHLPLSLTYNGSESVTGDDRIPRTWGYMIAKYLALGRRRGGGGGGGGASVGDSPPPTPPLRPGLCNIRKPSGQTQGNIQHWFEQCPYTLFHGGYISS